MYLKYNGDLKNILLEHNIEEEIIEYLTSEKGNFQYGDLPEVKYDRIIYLNIDNNYIIEIDDVYCDFIYEKLKDINSISILTHGEIVEYKENLEKELMEELDG